MRIKGNPLIYRILAGLSSSGKLGGREVKTSALVRRRSWIRIPPESPVKFFSHRHSESTDYTVLYTRRCKGKIKSIVYHPTQECHQPIIVIIKIIQTALYFFFYQALLRNSLLFGIQCVLRKTRQYGLKVVIITAKAWEVLTSAYVTQG